MWETIVIPIIVAVILLSSFLFAKHMDAIRMQAWLDKKIIIEKWIKYRRISRRAVAQCLSDLAYRELSVFKQLLCLFYTDGITVFHRGASRDLFENSEKMIFAHTAHGGVMLQLKVAVAVSVHMLNGVGNALPGLFGAFVQGRAFHLEHG